jgi:prepilin-type N-terminal cleavage/methylation domain-containing protein
MVDLNSNKGFTLIELMVTISVSLALFGVVVVGFNHFLATRKLENTQRELKSELRLVRSKAMNGEKPATGCDSLLGYSVRIESGTVEYAPVCDSGTKTYVAIGLTEEGVDLSMSPASFEFQSISGSLAEEDLVTVSVSYQSTTNQIQILSSGNFT